MHGHLASYAAGNIAKVNIFRVNLLIEAVRIYRISCGVVRGRKLVPKAMPLRLVKIRRLKRSRKPRYSHARMSGRHKAVAKKIRTMEESASAVKRRH